MLSVTSTSGVTLARRAVVDVTTNGTGVGSLSADGRSSIITAWFGAIERHAAMEAARSFSESVQGIPEVRAVVLDVADTEPRITTYIERRDLAVRSRVHAAEFAVLKRFRALSLDFRVLSLDSPAARLPEEGSVGIRIMFRR